MTTYTSTQGVLAPELEAIAAAAADRLRGEIAGTDQHEPETHHAVAQAASAAIAAGVPLGAIADAERLGQQRAREELRPDVLRQIARRKRETELEYEQAVIRGVRLGLSHRELAGAAQISHGTVRAVIARTQTSAAESTTAPERGETNDAIEHTSDAHEQPDAANMSAPERR